MTDLGAAADATRRIRPRSTAGRSALAVVLFGVLPTLLLAAAFLHWWSNDTLAWDFHHELYPQSKQMLSGENPYPGDGHDPATGTNLVWPPLAAYLIAPLTLFSPGVADVVFVLLGLGCFAATLWVVGVRDWRVYGVFALWPPVYIEMGLSHLTPVIALLTALAWRARAARYRSGLLVGASIALKFFVWPLALWLAAIGRRREALLAAFVAVISLILVLPYTGLDEYVTALLRLGRTFDQDSYSVLGLLLQAGAPDALGRAVTCLLAAGLLFATWRRMSFTLAIAAALAASPIVWLDYFALAAIPLAIARPRLCAVWFVPLATVGLEGAGLAIGDTLGTARALLAFGVVLAVAFRAEQVGPWDPRASTPRDDLRDDVDSPSTLGSGGTAARTTVA